MNQIRDKNYYVCRTKTKRTLLNAIIQRRRKRREGIELYIYRCPWCGSFHMTSWSPR